MDDKQADRVRVYGFIHEFLRLGNVEVARIIEPPDVSMQTALTPSGSLYQGGPFLIEQKYSSQLNGLLTNPFNHVTVTRLTSLFTSNNIFFVRQPTTILLVRGVFGEAWATLNEMRINYTTTDPDVVLKNPSLINQYSLIIVDCPGWFGDPSSYTPTKQAQIQAIYSNIRTHIQAGNEVIFTDIALKDLNAAFPGYVNLLGPNPGGDWAVTVHNPPNPMGSFSPEFPSQYYNSGPNPDSIVIPTYGSGYAVASIQSAHTQDVRVIMDSNRFGIPYSHAILGFYFPFGAGIVEGLTYDRDLGLVPVTIGSPSFFAVEQVYGNKFVHGPQVDFAISASPQLNTVQAGGTATYQVTLTSVGSFSSQVNLQVAGLPPSSSSNFSPNTSTPPASGSTSSQMTILTSQTTPIGTYNLTIMGTSLLPAITRTTTVTLIVTTQPSDFEISATPAVLPLNLTQCGNYTVSIKSVGNFSTPVALNATELPPKTTFVIQPNSVTPPVGATISSNFQVCIASDAKPGNYTLTITGTNATLFHSANVLLRVQTPAQANVNFSLILLLILLALLLALLLGWLAFRKSRRPAAAVPVRVAGSTKAESCACSAVAYDSLQVVW